MFSFYHWFFLLFSDVFIVSCICSLLCSLHFISSLCCCTASAMDLRELFLLRRCLLFTPLVQRWLLQQQIAPTWSFIKASLGSVVLPWRWLQSLILRFETKSRSICLFESHSVQQEVLVGWFYLCIKALRNIIQTSFRIWTHNLAICIVKRMSYTLDSRSS